MTNYIIGFIFGLFACYFYSWFTKEDKIEKGEKLTQMTELSPQLPNGIGNFIISLFDGGNWIE